MTKNKITLKKEREKERALKKEKNLNERALKHPFWYFRIQKKSFDLSPAGICTVKSRLEVPGFQGKMGQKFFFSGPPVALNCQ